MAVNKRFLVLWYDGNAQKQTIVVDPTDGEHLPDGDLNSGCEWLHEQLDSSGAIDVEVDYIIELPDGELPRVFVGCTCEFASLGEETQS